MFFFLEIFKIGYATRGTFTRQGSQIIFQLLVFGFGVVVEHSSVC